MINNLLELDVKISEYFMFIFHKEKKNLGTATGCDGIIHKDNDYTCNTCGKKLSPNIKLMLNLRYFRLK
jgi:hypothetical protein